MINREQMIRNYVEGYNEYDTDKMVGDFDNNIVFENISHGQLNMTLTGLAAFKEQAEVAKSYFSKRRQFIKSFQHKDDITEIEIDYFAILGMDFPNGLKKGDELRLHGKSIFQFFNHKIIKLTDIS